MGRESQADLPGESGLTGTEGLTELQKNIYEFVKNREKTTREELVTANGGRLAIVEFKKQESPFGPPLSIRLSPNEVEALVRTYGFSKESVHEVGPYHYAVVFRKG